VEICLDYSYIPYGENWVKGGINLEKIEMGAIKAPIENIHHFYILFQKAHDILFTKIDFRMDGIPHRLNAILRE